MNQVTTTTNRLPSILTTEGAQTELAKCEGCQGRPCKKSGALTYLQPVADGNDVRYVHCQFYIPEQKPVMARAGELFDDFRARINAEFKQQREQKRQAYATQYVLANMTDADYRLFSEVEGALRQCQSCGGQCTKSANRYERPLVTIVDGHPQISWEPCKTWRAICQERIRKGGIPLKYANRSFADYEQTPDNAEALKAAHWFLRKHRDRGLYFYGCAGTGKTFLASLIACECINQQKGVVFGDVPELLNRLKCTFDNPNQSADAILNRYCSTPLLILDDFGAGQITEWTVGVLYQIVNQRYNDAKPLIVTSNYDLKGLGERLSRHDNFGGQRIISRLSEMCYQAFLGITDRRR